jgi:carboxyl-terminal processing protease
MLMRSWILSLFLCSISPVLFAQDNSGNSFEVSKNLDIYFNLFNEVNKYYVDPIQPGKMVKKSIDEMLKDLDPYTNYITEEDVEDFRFQTTGKYGGIGCAMRDLGDYISIDDIYENGPAAKSGIKSGDVLLEIDGKSAKGLNDDEIRKLVKGSPGSIVKFKLKEAVTNQEFIKTVTREEISVNNVRFSTLVGANQEFAYVQLAQFTERCSNLVKGALDSLKKVNPNIKGVILDLRYNPGGLLDEAVNLTNLFISREQLVVSTKGKVQEWSKIYKTNNLPWDEKLPLVVIINKNSASASEIVSGTIQDLDRGVIVGQKSFGKGLVQSTRILPYNTQIKVTTAKYYTPSGRCIQALDYANRNEDGSVGIVADSMRSQFKTKNGRTVYDGGGIEPDISIDKEKFGPILSLLNTKNLVYQYANEYLIAHPQIAPAKSFEVTEEEYKKFTDWLSQKDFEYTNKSMDALQKMKTIAEKEKVFDNVKVQYDALLKELQQNKFKELTEYKKEIKAYLQAEIVSKYYFDKGKIENSLPNDMELKTAIQLLNDPQRYQKILTTL